MRPRIYLAALLVSLVCLALVGTASAAPLAKPEARKASVAKMNRYLASHPWAKAGSVGKCKRQSGKAIACGVVFRSDQRQCSTRIRVVAAEGRRKARLGKLKCSAPSPAPATFKRLGAFLGSTPKRNVVKPFEATYTYGATAVEEQAGRAAVEAEPPTGVLSLYSDGILECAINVGTGLTIDDCPVEHERLGTYRVTTIYTSGSESATATERYTIDPLPTATAIDVTYEALPNAHYLASGCEAEVCSLPEGFWENADVQIGVLYVSVSAVEPWGVLPKVNCPGGDLEPKAPVGCAALPQPIASSYALPVRVLADLEVHSDQDLVEGEPIDATMLAPKGVTILDAGINQAPVAAIEDGSRFFWGRSGTRAGFLSSEVQAHIQFTPEATATIVFR